MTRNSVKRIYLNQDEIIALNDFMRTICTSTKEGDVKVASYAAPWTDEAVAKHLKDQIKHITAVHVQGFRQRVFGELKRGGSTVRFVKVSELAARVEGLEATVKALTAWAKHLDPDTPFGA